MNKKIIFLVTILFVTITINMGNLYFKTQKELKSGIKTYKEFEIKANELEYLKKKYSNYSLKYIKDICKIGKKIECKNLSKSKLKAISQFIKSDIKLKSFEIEDKNSKFNFYAEIKE